jgi:hypothetical protein
MCAGNFFGTATFTSPSQTLTFTAPGGANDVFVAKYDPAGNLIWVRQAAGISD